MNKTKIKEAREELHQLVQLVGMVPRFLLPNDPSDSSASLVWDNDKKALITQPVNGVITGVILRDQELFITNGNQESKLKSIGKSKKTLLSELKSTLTDFGLEGKKLSTDLPYDLPETVNMLGDPFKRVDQKALQDLEHLYGVAQDVLITFFQNNEKASEIRCWPHHFDMASLLTVEEYKNPEESKSIGFGFSPGDGGYEEPYFYLTPWPYPEVDSLYDLDPPAIWNTEGWVGAVLCANAISEDTIKTTLSSFYKSGLEKLKPLL